MVNSFRKWLQQAQEPAPETVPPTVDGEVVEKEITLDDHLLRVQVEEIKDVCEKVLRQTEEPVDWWEVTNVLAGLIDDLLEDLDEQYNEGDEEGDL